MAKTLKNKIQVEINQNYLSPWLFWGMKSSNFIIFISVCWYTKAFLLWKKTDMEE